MTEPTAGVVTICVPVKQGAVHITECLQSVLAQDWPMESLEIVIVDGMSTDGTVALANELISDVAWSSARVVTNATATTPSNLNMGLQLATGEYFCRVDVRSRIPADYVRRCMGLLETNEAIGGVGGAQVAVANGPGAVSAGIARSLNNRYSMGGSRYRRGADSGTADTVYLGFYRTADLRALGGWDEEMLTNQDFELNQRIGHSHELWFESGLDVFYVPRDSFAALWRQYHRFGRWKVRYWKTRGRPSSRQVAAAAVLPAAVIGGFGVTMFGGLKGLVGAVTLASGSLVALEVVGSDRPNVGLRGHLGGVVGMVTVGAAWSTGVWRELSGLGGDNPAHDEIR